MAKLSRDSDAKPPVHGNAVRNSIIGPGIFNFDMSIMRNFRFATTKNLQFRLEVFNAFNQPVWNDPTTSFTSSNYGRILSTRKPMRELHIPPTVQVAVQQRTRQLSQAAQRLLTMAAVAGWLLARWP